MRYFTVVLAFASCSPFKQPEPEQKCYIINVIRDDNGRVVEFNERCAGSNKIYRVRECITDTECARFGGNGNPTN